MTEWLTEARANVEELRALVDAGTREIQHNKVCQARRHGDATAYQAYQCRCPKAREAQRLYRKNRRRDEYLGQHQRKVDATGTHRRIRALMRMGWSVATIMTEAGYSNGGPWLMYAETLHVDTARRIAEVYDRLWDKPGPSKWTRTYAERRHFLPPLAWDDDTIDDPSAWANEADEQVLVDPLAVERFIAGDIDWQALSVPERIEAGIRMQRAGVSRNEIHARCHVNQQQLQAALVAARPDMQEAS